MKKRIWIVGLLVLGFSAYGELRLPSLFTDGMVLQRDQEVPVWGWAEPGAKVSVVFAGQEKTVEADSTGKFMIRLKKMKASAKPQVLKVVSATDSAEVNNILIGEVWLCSGQSNMAWPVSKAMNFEEEKAAADYPLIRMFLTKRNASAELQEDCTGSWKVCTPDHVGAFSATAYFFGREIHKELGVPVGLIRSCWGGTCIEAWSPMASLDPYPLVMKYKAERNPKSQNYPANLYNGMINPLIPYGLRGAIWYQGESNAKNLVDAQLYRDLLENMVVQWRKDWDDIFPFYAVQLVNFKKPQQQPVENTPWTTIREGFLQFHKEVPNAGIAVGIDLGEANNIHPKNKQEMGRRLARQALAKTYGKDLVAGGPIYKSTKEKGNKIVLQFDDIGSGLVEQGGEPLKTFAIAGADKKFVFAQAAIVDDTVVVSSTEVPDPMAVRYAWADNPVGCNLYNKEGFPASPFRTDDWPLITE